MMTPSEYLEKIKVLNTPDEIKSVCDELTSTLLKPGYKDKTILGKLGAYNKVIRSGIPDDDLKEDANAYIQKKGDGTLWKRHLHFKYVGIADMNWNKQNAKTDVLSRLQNKKPIDLYKYLEVTSQLLLSEHPYELGVGLIAATGRRPIEILARGSFTPCNDVPSYLEPSHFLQFKGQAKKRDSHLSIEERTEYRIGVLFPADFILEAFRRFRKMDGIKEISDYIEAETEKGVDAETINNQIEDNKGNLLRRQVSKSFDGILPKRHDDEYLNNKALRAAYLAIVVKRDCPKNYADIVWASEAVGHFVNSEDVNDSELRNVLTTLGYYDYYVDSDVPYTATPQALEKEDAVTCRVFESDFDLIKKWQVELDLPNQQLAIHNIIEQAESAKDLRKQLFEAQEKINKLLKEDETMKVQVIPQSNTEVIPDVNSDKVEPDSKDDLKTMIETLIGEALQKHLPQRQKQPVQTPVKKLDTDDSQEVEKDWKYVPSQELKTTKGKGSAEEKIERAYNAMADYNDYKAKDAHGASDINMKWFIGNQALRQLSGCNGQLVSDWITRHRLAVDDHNIKHGLGQYHNKRHKQPITDVVSW